jgi:dipeptidyl aminopeptidase/acylaminoacyl peptidase
MKQIKSNLSIKIYTTFFLCLIIQSCAFDKAFHKSEKIPIALSDISYFNHGTDTIYLKYDSISRQLNFSNKDGSSKHPNINIENYYFDSKSGNKLNGWFLTPKEVTPIATILHLHGSGGNLARQHYMLSPFVELGFQILTVDYSGYGYSEGESTRENALADAYSSLDFLLKQEFINGTKIIIYGQSYGGYLASIVGANKTDLIDGVVIEGAFSSHRKEANFAIPILGNLVKKGIVADKEIHKLNKPVLVIHSTEDKIVPFKFGKTIYKAANQPKEFLEIEKAHIMGPFYYQKEISDKIFEMMID